MCCLLQQSIYNLHNCFTVAWNRECILMQSTHLLLSEGASVVVVALSRLCSRRLFANPRTVSLALPMFSPSILSTMDMSTRLGDARGACGKHGVGVGVGVGTLLNRCAPSQREFSPLDGLVDGGCPYLVFFDMVTVLSGDKVLWSSPSSLVGRLAISTSSTSCRVSRSFSRIPALGLNTPRWRGSSSGASGSRWAPTIWIFLFDLDENKAVKQKVLSGAGMQESVLWSRYGGRKG